MKTNRLILSTLFICGLSVFTSCSDTKDNPASNQSDRDERVVFEDQFSKDLQAMADDFRFDAATKAVATVKEFIDVLDENALAEKTVSIVSTLVQGLQATTLDAYPEQDKEAVITCLKERFSMTDQDIQQMPGIFVVDAYKSIGKMKLDFKDGQCDITDDAEAFTIVSTNSQGETQTLALTFNDERDGICFFVARLAETTPIAIQLPKSIGITLTTPRGEIINGTINLTTIDADQSKFVNFKVSGWMADGKLIANVNNRQESASLYIKHTESRAFDLNAAFAINGKEMARLDINDMHDSYTNEEINSEEFMQMREMGPFFSGAYDILKALKGKSVDNVVITMNDNMVIDGSVDDIAKSLLALGNVRKLYGTQPGMETIDKYTQELNSLVHFTVSQKNTGITAQGTLQTAIKNQQEGEYQPVVALRFKGETEAKPMFARMTQTDQENYKKMFDNFSPLIAEVSETLIVARKKGEAIVTAFKNYFAN